MPAHSASGEGFKEADLTGNQSKMPNWEVKEDIVISGMSARLPESSNIGEFRDNLYNKVDMVTEDDRRWEPGYFGMPGRMGKLKDISKFDAHFFEVHHKQAHVMDPQLRLFLECTHEAIVDAGYDPKELRGQMIGVYVGLSSSESDEFFSKDISKINAYALTGCCRAMFSNRISYAFDFKGPSYSMDSACSSSATALQQAILAIRTNQCTAAIVAGCNLCLRPSSSMEFHKLNMLSSDGKCKTFDERGDGYARSEAAVCVFLQKASNARRIYATVVHAKCNTDGYKEQGITYPSGEIQRRLIEEVYSEAKIDPREVSFMEAHGTGTKVGDPQEISSIVNVLCKNRAGPLLIGSVKTNMGHSEPASGLCSLVKVIIAMEEGKIPPNLHFSTPNPEIPALNNGLLKVVTEITPFTGKYASLNCFGFGGANVHMLLKVNPKEASKAIREMSIPQVAFYCERTEDGINDFFDYLERHKPNRDFFSLLHNSAYISNMTHRGYAILNKDGSIVTKDLKEQNPKKRPVWYIFSGMGTQWPAMAKDLMQLDVFTNSIHRSAKCLKPHGIDLIKNITEADDKITQGERNIIPAFVSIAAVQVALVDVLKELGIRPDGVVGHSVGELGCAYADDCLTGEQMVLSAYWRGKAVETSNLIHGSMAAIGLTWEEAKQRCPEGVLPACHNSEDTVTISGPKDKIAKYVDVLKSENVFAREVDSCGYAFHSRYIFPAAAALKQALDKVITNPKPRTSRWISSSIPEEKWNEPVAKMSDAAYLVNNLVSPVLFREALQHIPDDAITIEIAPHHLLQAILKRSLAPSCDFLGLMKKNQNNLEYLLTAIGRMYLVGMNPKIEKLYPAVSYPVSRGTPMISPLVRWNHSDTWAVAKWETSGAAALASESMVEVDVSSEESPEYYLLDHKIDGRFLFPATGYLTLAWKAFAHLKGQDYKHMPVVFENVSIKRATILSKAAPTRFLVNIMNISGEFEICESGMVAASGSIRIPEEKLFSDNVDDNLKKPSMTLTTRDIYKELRLRGYEYGPAFQGIIESNLEGNCGKLVWNNDWISFLDTMLQYGLLSSNFRTLRLPTRINSIKIDPDYHVERIEKCNDNGIFVHYDPYIGKCTSGGVEISGHKATIAPRRQGQQDPPILDKVQFVPYHEKCVLDNKEYNSLQEYIQVCSALARKILEARGKNKAQITDVMNGFKEADENVLRQYLNNISENQVVLQMLQKLHSTASDANFVNNVKNVINNHQDISKDILSSILLEDKFLGSVLDVVMENTPSSNIKILEVNSGDFPLFSKILNGKYTFNLFLNLSYSIAHPTPDVLDEKLISSNGVKSIKWDISSTPTNEMANIDLVVAKHLSSSKNDLKESIQKLHSMVKENTGFILLLSKTELTPAERFLSVVGNLKFNIHSEEELESAFRSEKLSVVCKKSDSLTSTMYLLRKEADIVPQDQSIIHITDEKYNLWVETLKEKLNEHQQKPIGHNIWLVAEDTPTNGIMGMINCLRQEPGGDKVRYIFNASEDGHKDFPAIDIKDPQFQRILQKNLYANVFYDKQWGTYRHIPLTQGGQDITTTDTEHAYINVLTRGDLSSLRFVDSHLKYWSKTNSSSSSSFQEELCYVYYAPLNFRDIMLASGKLPPDAIPGNLAMQDCILGFEFSGRTLNGKRVMGVLGCKSLATTVLVDPEFMWEVPDHWTLEEASTLPVVYSTAYYSLIYRGGLKHGEKVLIHSGSGGVGQAAIAIALSMGCEVYTTVGSVQKKEFLKKLYPQLKDHNFSSSRDLSFEKDILHATKGKGVDVVLNSLAEEKLQASIRCLADHGRFLEIGKYDLSNNSALGMAVFLKNISFHGVLLDSLFEDTQYAHVTKSIVVALVKEGMKSGVVKPLNVEVFHHEKVEDAFRFMASGKHMGKVVLKMKDEEKEKVVKPVPIKVSACTRTYCHPNKSYIITGGLGGFGLELADWLIERGAQHIILTSRTGPRSGYQHLCLHRWKNNGVHVVVSTSNASKKEECAKLLKEAASIAPVGGIFNLAMVLKDSFMENQSVENYELVTDPKVKGTKNLDSCSRQLCPQLHWFVCFSSVSSGRGNAGQSNYGYANAVMERICDMRKKQGLPGLAIQWGAIGDVGVVEETMKDNEAIGGTLPQRITSCIATLDRFLQEDHSIVSSFVQVKKQTSDSGKKGSKLGAFATVARIFGIKDTTTITDHMTLGELGMDSLMGVEVKQLLERDYSIVRSIQELRQMHIQELKDLDQESSSNKGESSETDSSHEKAVWISHIRPPVETVIHLNSQTKHQGTPLFIVHSIEGMATMLGNLAQLLSCPVYGLQCTAEVPKTSVEDMAKFYWQKIQSLYPNSPIFLGGYSFGGGVAFEMALQAEANVGKLPAIQSLVMLDGSPNFVTTYVHGRIAKFTRDFQSEGESEAVVTFLLPLVPIDIKKMKDQLLNQPSYEARLKLASDTILEAYKDSKLDRRNIEWAADHHYKTLLISRQYKPALKLKKNLTLIKASNSIDFSQNLSESYDLDKLSDGKIKIHVIEGNHRSILQGKAAENIADILKKELPLK